MRRATHWSGNGRQVQLLVADETAVVDSETGLIEGRLHLPHRRVPVHGNDPLAFAPLNHDVEALDGHEQHQPLHPIRLELKGVLVLEIFDLGCVLALAGVDPECFTATFGFSFPRPAQAAIEAGVTDTGLIEGPPAPRQRPTYQ